MLSAKNKMPFSSLNFFEFGDPNGVIWNALKTIQFPLANWDAIWLAETYSKMLA